MSAREIEISDGPLRLELRPEWGGRVAAFSHRELGDILVPMRELEFQAENWPRAGAYPLVPFHNRVRGASFAFADREAKLEPHPDARPNALHGMGSRAVWNVIEVGPSYAEIEWRWDANRTWPWRFSARQRFELRTDRLVLRMNIRNEDDAPMPAGLGWHPYFPAGLSCDCDARIDWPIDDAYLPFGLSRRRGELGPTAYLSDWREVSLSGTMFDATVRHEGLEHLVLHAPLGGNVLCVEPVSHLATALNEPWRRPGAEEGGMNTLPPSAELVATIEIVVRPCVSAQIR